MSSLTDRAIIPRLLADVGELKQQNGRLLVLIEQFLKVASERDVGSHTIAQFCRRHNLSESQYFKLQREGRGPRTMHTGAYKGKRISVEAELDWIADREREATTKAESST
jgi:hypothetical protein